MSTKIYGIQADKIIEQRRRITALEAEVAGLREDAERYRWLRDGENWPAAFEDHDTPEPLRGLELDAAIEAARKGGKHD